jgi:endoglucanase
MTKIKILFVIISLTFITAFVEKDKVGKFVGVSGKEIITPDGKPILLKGINLGNWLVPEGYMFKFKKASSPRLIDQAITELTGPEQSTVFWNEYLNTYITREDILYIKKLGFNHVRVPFNYKMLTDEYYLGKNNRGYEFLDRVVKWCKEAEIYVLLDMHCAPGGQTGDNIDDGYGYPFLFESPQCQEKIISIWKEIAIHYKDETIILGYDLMNEPIAHYFENRDTLNKSLVPLYKKITKVIREIDPNHLIFLGGAQWNTNFKIFDKPFDDKLVYTFHKYWFKVEPGAIQEYVNFRDKYNVPIYIGETGENTDEWIKDFRVLLEGNNIGWCFWPYKKMDSPRCIVSFKTPEGYQNIISYADSSRQSFEEIRNRRLLVKQADEILHQFNLESKIENCYLNAGYIEALGLKPLKIR